MKEVFFTGDNFTMLILMLYSQFLLFLLSSDHSGMCGLWYKLCRYYSCTTSARLSTHLMEMTNASTKPIMWLNHTMTPSHHQYITTIHALLHVYHHAPSMTSQWYFPPWTSVDLRDGHPRCLPLALLYTRLGNFFQLLRHRGFWNVFPG